MQASCVETKSVHSLVTFGLLLLLVVQEAQLPQRDSASAMHGLLGSLNDRAFH